jgi:hypothetical protein
MKERLASNASFYKINVFDIGAWLYTQYQGFLGCRMAALICGLAVGTEHVCNSEGQGYQLSSSSSSYVASGI